jgi:hypothetical protein
LKRFGDPEAIASVADDNTAGVILETIPATLGVVISPDRVSPIDPLALVTLLRKVPVSYTIMNRDFRCVLTMIDFQ